MTNLSLHSTLLLICFSSAILTVILAFDKMESSIVRVLGNTTNAVSFAQFVQTYEKKYNSIEEMKHRFAIFSKNLEFIESTNKKNLSYTLGVNEIADLSSEEIKQYRSRLEIPDDFLANTEGNYTLTDTVLPLTIDWRDEGIVTPVKRQGPRCKSCWAISATGALESAYSQKYLRGIYFSEQQLVDCSQPFGDAGCEGGRPDNAFRYVKYAGGISTEVSYPYIGVETGHCKFSPSMIAGVLRDYAYIKYGDEYGLKHAVGTLRPVSVGFHSQDDFDYYKGGIYRPQYCPRDLHEMNHAMLVVGYGIENGISYWIVKNGWGVKWGEQGYGRVAIGKNVCGIANLAIVPTIQ